MEEKGTLTKEAELLDFSKVQAVADENFKRMADLEIYGYGRVENMVIKGNILDIAANLDIINKSGAWFSYNGERLGQGRENVKQLLKENSALAKELEEKIREKL